MRKHFFLAILLCSAAFSAPRVLAADVAPGKFVEKAARELSPEETVRMLVFYANRPQALASYVAAYVIGADVKKSSLAHVSETLENQFGQSAFSAQVKEKKIVGDTATVTAQVTLRNPKTGLTLRQLETLTLRRVATKGILPELEKEFDFVWQVQPDKTLLAHWEDDDIGVLARLAVYIGFSDQVEIKNAAWTSQNNLKQLSLAALQVAQAHSATYLFTNDTFKQSLLPYVSNENIFTAPSGEKGSVGYMMNVALVNLNLAKIEAPAETVGIYESKDGALDFRYDGKAAVGFADGHVKLVSREEAKALRWKP